MAKLTLDDISAYRNVSITKINEAFEKIEAWSDTVLSRDGTSPNQMEADFDANSNYIINTPLPLFNHHAVNKEYVDLLFNTAAYGDLSATWISSLQDQIESNDGDIASRATITYVDTVIATEASARATSVTALEADITQNSTDIASRATILYVDNVEATLTGSIATATASITAAYQAADTALETDINTKATITYVDTSIATVNSAIATSESTIRAEYQGADLVIRQVNSNLLQNPSGVDGLSGWTNTTNWSTNSSPIGNYITTTSTGVQTINSAPISVTAVETYSFAFRSGGQTFTSGACNIIWRNGSGTTLRTDTISITSQDAYPEYSNSYAAPASAVDCIVQFTCNLSSGFFLFHKVKVEQASAPTMFTDDIFFVNSSASITTNTTAIASNTGSIATLTTSVSSNTSGIATNTADVTTNASAITSNTSGIASLTTSVSTNGTNISTNATAITTVDNKLSAKYALTVDANGRIAQMALLSNGTTSSVRFKADSFKIFDGSSNDIAPFAVSGGVVSMTNVEISGSLLVDGTLITGKIADNAVTNVEGSIVEGNTSQLNEDTWYTVASDSIMTSGGTILLNSDFTVAIQDNGYNNSLDIHCRIYRDSTLIRNEYVIGRVPVIGDSTLGFTTVGIQSYTVTESDNPSAGTYTYKVELKWSGASGSTVQTGNTYMRSMILTELKK